MSLLPILFAVDVTASIKVLDMQNLLSVAALAEFLGVAKRTIYNRHFAQGDLPPSIKIGTRLLFDPADVRTWLDSKKQSPCTLTPTPVAAVARRCGRPTKAESIARRKTEPQRG